MYDLFVIGGGSGGLACSKRAVSYGKKVALATFAKPSPLGTSWGTGIGGTCVNVGCVPKKLMHYASLFGESRIALENAGWGKFHQENQPFNWEHLVESVTGKVQKISEIQKTNLVKTGVELIHGWATLKDPNTIHITYPDSRVEEVTAEKILIAVGERPKYLDIPGCKEHCITSDDLFWTKKTPGHTLVVGGGYIGMECAGFLKGLGYDVDLVVTSVPMRPYDRSSVDLVVSHMEKMGVKFHSHSKPTSFEKLPCGKILASWDSKTEGKVSKKFDTVLLAVGRTADTSTLGLEELGVATEYDSIVIDDCYKTSVESIYAVGDIIKGSRKLTPVAIKEGRVLADNLYGGKSTKVNYSIVPTTFFTPIEFGTVGLTEKQAFEEYKSN